MGASRVRIKITDIVAQRGGGGCHDRDINAGLPAGHFKSLSLKTPEHTPVCAHIIIFNPTAIIIMSVVHLLEEDSASHCNYMMIIICQYDAHCLLIYNRHTTKQCSVIQRRVMYYTLGC